MRRATSEESEIDYFDLLHRRYRPVSLPLQVQLLISKHDPRLKHRLWRALACRGVVLRQLFDEHHHFHTASMAGKLAAAIAEIMVQIGDGDSSPQPVHPVSHASR